MGVTGRCVWEAPFHSVAGGGGGVWDTAHAAHTELVGLLPC